jgi:hypothetical protein
MTSVFICYAREDISVADYIAAELRRRGAEIHIDFQQRIAGENFLEYLKPDIESCDYFLLVLSRRALLSKWVKAETAWALTCKNEILPVLLEPTSLIEFLFLEASDLVDFQKWNPADADYKATQRLAVRLGLPEKPIKRSITIPKPPDSFEPEESESDYEGFFFLDDTITTTDAKILQESQSQAEVNMDEEPSAPSFGEQIIWVEESYEKPPRKQVINRQDVEDKIEFSREFLIELFISANRFRIKEPENAYFLYKLISDAIKDGDVAEDTKARDALKPEIDLQESVVSAGIGYKQISKEPLILQGHTDEIRSLFFSPDGKFLASASLDNTIRLWDVKNGISSTVISERNVDICIMTFAPDGKTIASASHDITKTDIRLWDVKQSRNTMSITGHTRRITSLAFAPNNAKLLASSSEDGTINLWEFRDRGENIDINVVHLCSSSDFPQRIGFSFDGEILASVLYSGTILIWNPEDKKDVYTLTTQREIIKSLSFSPNDFVIAYGTQRKNIELWDITTRKHLRTFTGHQATVECTAFSPCGNFVASGSRDGTVKLWDITTGNVLESLNGQIGFIQALDFSPDKSFLATASNRGEIIIWRI